MCAELGIMCDVCERCVMCSGRCVTCVVCDVRRARDDVLCVRTMCDVWCAMCPSACDVCRARDDV
eukprot:4901696-Prymnesium_polylepis.2